MGNKALVLEKGLLATQWHTCGSQQAGSDVEL